MKATEGLVDLIGPIVSALGYEFWGVTCGRQGTRALITVYIDRTGGVNLDDCALISRQLSSSLAVEETFQHRSFTLEVSSPGLNRLLLTETHFKRFIGHQVDIELHRLIAGRRHYKGALKDIQNGQVSVEVENIEYLLPFSDIKKARLVPDLL